MAIDPSPQFNKDAIRISDSDWLDIVSADDYLSQESVVRYSPESSKKVKEYETKHKESPFKNPSPNSLSPAEVRFEETDMPKEFAGKHTGIKPTGSARRIHAIDPFSDKKYRVHPEHGRLEEHEEGTKGLVGYADVYKIPGETRVGFIQSTHRGAGKNLLQHLQNTTDGRVWLGSASKRMEKLADNANVRGGDVRYY